MREVSPRRLSRKHTCAACRQGGPAKLTEPTTYLQVGVRGEYCSRVLTGLAWSSLETVIHKMLFWSPVCTLLPRPQSPVLRQWRQRSRLWRASGEHSLLKCPSLGHWWSGWAWPSLVSSSVLMCTLQSNRWLVGQSPTLLCFLILGKSCVLFIFVSTDPRLVPESHKMLNKWLLDERYVWFSSNF